MTDIDTSPPALRALIRRLGDVAARSPLDDKETRDVYTACSLLRALAAEKEAAAQTVAELTRERDGVVKDHGDTIVELAEALQRAEKAEAERDEARERYQNCVTQAKDWQQVANDRSAEIVRLFRAVQSHETAHDEAVEQRELAWRCQHSLQKDYDEARAEAAAMREAAVALVAHLDKFNIRVSNGLGEPIEGIEVDELKAMRAALSSTAGRDLLARMERMRVALKVADTALTHDYPRDCWATGPATGDPIADLIICPGCEARITINAAIADQPGEKQ